MATDRLMDLQREILAKILYSLDTKQVVRLSLVSPSYRNLWKEIPVLNFRPKTLKSRSFVDHVLNCRHPSSDLQHLQFYHAEPKANPLTHAELDTKIPVDPIIEQIFTYAKHHNISVIETDVTEFPKTLHDSQTLSTLKIQQNLLLDTTLSFKYLKTLVLTRVYIRCKDLLTDCCNLESLELIQCSFYGLKRINDNGFVVNAPRLVNLTINRLLVTGLVKKVRVLSPGVRRLKMERMNVDRLKLLDFSECREVEDVEVSLYSRVDLQDLDWVRYVKMVHELFVNAENAKVRISSLEVYELRKNRFIPCNHVLVEELSACVV